MDANLGELVRRAQAGDRRALDQVFAITQEHTLRLVRDRVDPRILAKEDCEDISSSVSRELVEDFPRFEFRGEAPFFAYLQSAIDNKIRGKAAYYHAQCRDLKREIPIDQALRPSVPPASAIGHSGDDPSRRAIDSEIQRSVDEAIRELPEPDRTVIELYRLGYTDASIGERIGKNGEQSRYLRLRATAALRGRLQKLRTAEK